MSMVKGRCLCGGVRYEYEGEVNWTGHCHCESCRRNCSAPMTTFFAVNNGNWRWTGDTPGEYHFDCRFADGAEDLVQPLTNLRV